MCSLVRRCSDALAAAVAPYAQREVEPLGYNFVPSRASPLNANLHFLPHCEERNLLCDAALVSGCVCRGKEGTREDRHRVTSLKWEFDGIGFRKTFGCDPKDVIEVCTIEERLIISEKLDVICERVTGGPFALGHHFVPTLASVEEYKRVMRCASNQS